ncbi:MAG: hypothetical protein WBA73_16130 [Devosia sp.]
MRDSSGIPPIAPRGLQQDAAAAYAGVTTGAFMKLVAEGRMPVPKRLGGHLVWDRYDIDRYFDAMRSDLPDMAAWQSLLTAALGEKPPPAPDMSSSSTKTYKHWYDMPVGPEMLKRKEKEDARDRAELRKRPMGKWERVGLWELYRRRGKLVDVDLMRGVAWSTHEALHTRGYVTVRRNKHEQIVYWQINDRGIEAVKKIPEEPSPSFRPGKEG